MLNPELKKKVDTILADTSHGELAKWKNACSLLLAEGVIYKQKIQVQEMMVRPQNRGGTMIQVYNMHLKGKRIIECGFDASLLAASTCFEVSPEERNKTYQIQANQKIHEAHQDFFVKCSGHERFLSVSSSHVSQFLKAFATRLQEPRRFPGRPKDRKNEYVKFQGQ